MANLLTLCDPCRLIQVKSLQNTTLSLSHQRYLGPTLFDQKSDGHLRRHSRRYHRFQLLRGFLVFFDRHPNRDLKNRKINQKKRCHLSDDRALRYLLCVPLEQVLQTGASLFEFVLNGTFLRHLIHLHRFLRKRKQVGVLGLHVSNPALQQATNAIAKDPFRWFPYKKTRSACLVSLADFFACAATIVAFRWSIQQWFFHESRRYLQRPTAMRIGQRLSTNICARDIDRCGLQISFDPESLTRSNLCHHNSSLQHGMPSHEETASHACRCQYRDPQARLLFLSITVLYQRQRLTQFENKRQQQSSRLSGKPDRN